MKIKPSKLIIAFVLLLLSIILILIALNASLIGRKNEANILLLPSLPKPIAEEYVLITSAGQNTDAYIVWDVANKLMIHNYFMPQAEKANLEGVNTLVFVVGYSSIGEKLHGTTFEDEKRRINRLVEEADKGNLTVITVYISEEQRYYKNAEELLRIVVPESDYIIASKQLNKESLLSELVKMKRTAITLINKPKDLSEPFASAFR